MDRRSFLRKGGLFGALVAAASAPAIAEAATKKPAVKGVSKDMQEALESNPMSLHLQAGYGEKIAESQERMRITSEGGFYFNPQPEYNTTVNVALKPGPDGELYIKKNGEWKRIVTT